jgi:hypothetical protein
MVFYVKDEKQFNSFLHRFKNANRQFESFFGVEIDAPQDLSDFESVDEEEDFETLGMK